MPKNYDESVFEISRNEQEYVERAINLFKEKEDSFETRYRSWDSCHKFFNQLYIKNHGKLFEDLSNEEKEFALLNLAYYLASWGMYRGSSFTLQFDNSIFKDVVSIVLKDEYKILWNLNLETIKKFYKENDDSKNEVLMLLIQVRNELNEVLKPYRQHYNTKSDVKVKLTDEEKEVSQTLITKILLGTICCCPAYDQFYRNAVNSAFNDFFKDYKIKNILKRIVKNEEFFKTLDGDKKYPLMKQIDMAYFTIGLEKDFYEKYYKTYIVNNIVPSGDENKKLRKYLNQFYYKFDAKSPCKLHVAFTHDEVNTERYIKQNFVEKEREK